MIFFIFIQFSCDVLWFSAFSFVFLIFLSFFLMIFFIYCDDAAKSVRENDSKRAPCGRYGKGRGQVDRLWLSLLDRGLTQRVCSLRWCWSRVQFFAWFLSVFCRFLYGFSNFVYGFLYGFVWFLQCIVRFLHCLKKVFAYVRLQRMCCCVGWLLCVAFWFRVSAYDAGHGIRGRCKGTCLTGLIRTQSSGSQRLAISHCIVSVDACVGRLARNHAINVWTYVWTYAWILRNNDNKDNTDNNDNTIITITMEQIQK